MYPMVVLTTTPRLRSYQQTASSPTRNDSPTTHTHTLTGEVASPLVSPRKAPTIMEEGEVEGGKEDGGGDTSLLGVALVPHPNHAAPTSSVELATTSLSTALQG